jgi:hypothetical protein
MRLESKWIDAIKEKLTREGYNEVERGLVVYGGKDNGTVDLMATNEDKESVVIEIKNHPIHLIDLSHFLTLKKNIENKITREKIQFFLITCEENISSPLKEIANSKEIKIEKFQDFMNRRLP